MPTCWIIAGPNGAGKTTFALEYHGDIREIHQDDYFQMLLKETGI